MTGQGERFHLQMAIRFDVVNQLCSCRSAGAILADQLLWRKLKRLSLAVLSHGLHRSKSLTPAFSWITTSDLLQIVQRLLTEPALRRHDSLTSS